VCCSSTSGIYFLAVTVGPYIRSGAIERVFTPMGGLYFVLQAILANCKPLKSGLRHQLLIRPIRRLRHCPGWANEEGVLTSRRKHPPCLVYRWSDIRSKHGRWLNSCCFFQFKFIGFHTPTSIKWGEDIRLNGFDTINFFMVKPIIKRFFMMDVLDGCYTIFCFSANRTSWVVLILR
jgi:hypothetical protein